MNILERFEAMDYGPAPESRAEADAWLAGRDFGKSLFIGGEWRHAAGGRTFDVLEPSSTRMLAQVSDAGQADIDAAVDTAARALPAWSASSGYERAKVLYAIGRAMQRHQRLFAVLESIDNGKPIRESRDIDVPLAIRHFIHHAGWAQSLDASFPGHQPVGVCGQIIPWNFPLLMLAWKIAPALAAGCTVVLKPAEFTPLTERLFAVLESIDNGKPIRESRDIDVPLAIRHFIHHAGWAQSLDVSFPGQQPVGVCGQIIPWNFPLLMLAWKIAPALAAGCTVVLKPAEFTPLTAILFAEICERAGVPKGVVNILPGGPGAGAALVKHPGVHKIAFTGSSEVGKIIRRATAGSGKKLSLELGGKSAFIVFEDADLDSAVEGMVDGIWFNQGQVCCAGSRLLVQEGIAEALIAKVKARMGRLRIGSPLDKNTDIGPLVDETQLERVTEMVAKGAEEGAECWQPACALPDSGYFHLPVLATGVSPSNILAQEEVFGPVLAAMTFRSTDEAIELANNTRYGLAASVWSENINLALHAAPQLKAGVVWINGANMFDASAGFGGYRESGFGREGGREGMDEYLTRKLPIGAVIAAPGIQPGPHADFGEGPAAGIDRTAKLFIGGKQARPDGNYSYVVADAGGTLAGEAGLGNRKDIRDAVAAARACRSWPEASGYNRSQVLYYLAENLSARRDEFASRIARLTGSRAEAARAEVELSVERLFLFAGLADKFEGRVHNPPMRAVTLALNEPVGVVGIVTGDAMPLLSVVTLVGPALAMGNTVVLVPSEQYPLIATDLYQVIETSDVPAGAINIVTGRTKELTGVLARHNDVDGLWIVAEAAVCADAEEQSADNLKRIWTSGGRALDWGSDSVSGETFLARAVEVKNVWVPYGD